MVNCVVKYKEKILVVQRSEKLNFYPGYWNGISGFLDDARGLKGKVEEEVRKELGIAPQEIKRIRLGEIFDQEEPKYRKTWAVHPVLVEVITNRVALDWEARQCRWVSVREAKRLRLLPGFETILEKLSAWI